MQVGRTGICLTAVIWVFLALAPVLFDEWRISQLSQYMTYGIFAISLALVWGQGGMLCFGQAMFFGIGAYLMALTTLGKLPFLGTSQAIGMLLAILGPALAAFIFGYVLFRGRGLSGAFFAIVTLSAAVIMEIGARHWRFIGGFNGLLGVPPLQAPWRQGHEAYLSTGETFYVVFVVALAAYLLMLRVQRSPFGTVLASIRGNEDRTRYFGYDVSRYKIAAFTLSGGVAGCAGALFAAQLGFVSPTLTGFGLSTEVLIWTAVGGRSVLMAAFLGAILVRGIEGMLFGVLGNYWLMALGVIFIVTVVVAPRGLFGRILALPLPSRLAIRQGSPPQEDWPSGKDRPRRTKVG